MSTVQKLSLALVGTAVLLMSANPASAVSLSTGNSISVPGEGQKTNIQGATTIDFNSGTATDPNGFATYSTTNGIVQGTQPNQYAAPAGDTSNYLTISPIGSSVAGSTGSVTINFAKALDYFGLYWGSVDKSNSNLNSIAFFNGDTLLNTFTGLSVPGTTTNGGDQTSPKDNVFVNFLADPGQTFNKVVLSSSGVAFESDNHAYRAASVPEPTSMLGLLAFGAVSAGSFIKRKSKLV
ncbi:MAG: PEP-CTERM sorting domain-containing protein [Nostoc sp. NOS(2021)]|uniref:Npun_F0296 family exosortase-dependent surface protein n=1 Tax=Nostoc sp. NOS(2021) TaxID=2815407 RepID=UPI0025CF990B|nr:PEP-CTERM sorting domain-containing protein [Nostoc sp. NOS(2021)]MBN3897470.1 PEP-CTERM sorting domain-containing protein [Nostoc sp. NOS(2021)]